MRPASAAMIAHLAGAVTTLASCLKITRADGVVIAMTDHQSDLVVSGRTYKTALGYNLSALRHSVDLGSVDAFNFDGILDAAGLTYADIKAGRYGGAAVELFWVNYNDLTMGILPGVLGTIGAITPSETGYSCEVLNLKRKLENPIVERTSPLCRAILGDSRCRTPLAGMSFAGTVTGVTDDAVFSCSAFAGPATANYFPYGVVTWLTGANAGLSVEIKGYVSGTKTFTLRRPMPFPIANGDTLTALVGCDKKFPTCQTKFNDPDTLTLGNQRNFRGEPHIPTESRARQRVRPLAGGWQGGSV